MIRILYSCFEQKLPDQELAAHLALFPVSIKNKFLKFQRWQDKQAYLFGKLLLLMGLEQFGVTCDLEKLQYTSYCRPYINNSIDFNISHSGHYVACVLSDSYKVGIDIEQVSSINIGDFECYMLPDELDKINRSKNKSYEFYEYWTRKESVAKADGRGLSIPLKKIIIRDDVARLENATWYLKKIKLVENYVVHLASNTKYMDPIICEVDL